jgi:hypothetical protein
VGLRFWPSLVLRLLQLPFWVSLEAGSDDQSWAESLLLCLSKVYWI